ncbi:MAG TPA: hemerythrin domain-containing protein, partial [Myxococcales bacterium]|nr:hemerythrin domain-containing protein [Myxococcales bacterium]
STPLVTWRNGERFEAKVKVLSENVRHHVEEEQDEMFPRVQKLLGQELLDQLGERMARAKKLAPTRPHPRAPDSPPGNIVAGTMAAVMDKSKDLLRGLVSRGASAISS